MFFFVFFVQVEGKIAKKLTQLKANTLNLKLRWITYSLFKILKSIGTGNAIRTFGLNIQKKTHGVSTGLNLKQQKQQKKYFFKIFISPGYLLSYIVKPRKTSFR